MKAPRENRGPVATDQNIDDRPSRRRSRRQLRLAVLAVAALAVFASLAAACSSEREGGIAEVTLPELDTTTTTVPPNPPAGRAQGGEPPDPEWTVQVGGPGDDVLSGVASRDERVFAVGSTSGGLPGTEPGPGGIDVLLAVVSTDGELESVSAEGSDGDDEASGVAVSDAGVLACGSTTGALGSEPRGDKDIWCAPLSEDRAALGPPTQFGGADGEEITAVAGSEDADRLYLTGRAAGLLPGAQDPTGRGLGAGDAITLQLSGAQPVWARQFGTPAEDAALGVAITPELDAIAVGYTDGDVERASSGGRDAWISRFDPAGRQRWIIQFGSAGTDQANAVAISGEASRGTEQFVAVGTSDGGLGKRSSGDGGSNGDGGSGGLQGPAGPDAFVASFGPDGALRWTTELASGGEDRGAAIVADGALLYVAGTTNGDLGDLLPDTGPGGGSDGFLAALDAASGEVLWTVRFGSAGDEEITGMTATEDGLLVLSGTTTGQMATTEPGGGVDGFLIAFPLSASGGGAASSV